MNTDENHSENENIMIREAVFPQKHAYDQASCNFDDSLGIESIKSDKQTGEYFKANLP